MKNLKLFKEYILFENTYDYDGYQTNSPFNTLGDFLSKLNVDLNYEIDEEGNTLSDYLDDEIDNILELDITNDEKINRMIEIITDFDIDLPPYKWTKKKKKKLKKKLQDMFDFLD
jgi:hypothetical protein